MNNRLREEIHQLHAQLCKGLADPNRILILYSLALAPLNVTELTEVTNLPQPTVSRHLGILRSRGMVKSVRQGQSIQYEVADLRIIQALDIMRAVMTDQLKTRGDLLNSVQDTYTSPN